MKERAGHRNQPSNDHRSSAQGHGRIVTLVLTCLVLGFLFGAWWHYRTGRHGTIPTIPQIEARLSEGTKAVLHRLDSPLEVRFYAVLDPSGGFDALRAFAGRVDQLLSEFQQEANGKLQVVRYKVLSDAATAAASADGLRPFNLDKGDACYLGIVVAQKGRKESLPQVSPEWEPALEFDLSRAIDRVISAGQPGQRLATTTVNPAVTAELKGLIPDPAAVSLEEGTQILRQKAMAEFAATTKAMETQLQEAEQRFVQAQSANSETAQQTARKEIEQIRAQQTEKLKKIASRLQDQIAVLEQMKKQ